MYYQEVLKYTLFTYVNVKYRSRCTRYPLPYHVVYMWYLYHVSSVYRYHMYVHVCNVCTSVSVPGYSNNVTHVIHTCMCECYVPAVHYRYMYDI
jgi:hypothetical protein